MATIQPNPGFDWSRVKWGGPNEPQSDAEDAVPLRMWAEDGSAAVFCDPCSETWFGMTSLPPDLELDEP